MNLIFLNTKYFFLRNDVNHEDFELKFNYSFLAPPVDHPVFDEKDEEVHLFILQIMAYQNLASRKISPNH